MSDHTLENHIAFGWNRLHADKLLNFNNIEHISREKPVSTFSQRARRSGARAAANIEPKTLTFVASDQRADGAERRVSIDARRVRIERRIGGIAMHIGLMASAYRGVALSLSPANSGGTCYRVSLLHRDRDLDVELRAVLDEADGLAAWRDWAAYFALPQLVENAPARFEIVAAPFGALTIGPRPMLRRRSAVLSKRRPSIRLRRRMPPRRAMQVFGGEREIIGYE